MEQKQFDIEIPTSDKAWCPNCKKEVTEKELACNFGECQKCNNS